MALRKHKSRKQQATDRAVELLRIKPAGKAAKGATKAAKGTAVYKVAQKNSLLKRASLVVGAGLAALLATKVVRGRGNAEATA